MVFLLQMMGATLSGAATTTVRSARGAEGPDAIVQSPPQTEQVVVGGTKNVALFDVIVNYMLFLRLR